MMYKIPIEIERSKETIIGDVDAFIAYIESVQVLLDWHDVIEEKRRVDLRICAGINGDEYV